MQRRVNFVAVLAAAGAVLAPAVVVPSWATTVEFEGRMSDVSCVSTTMCVAVGYRVATDGPRYPRAFHWNGTSWSQRTVPSPAGPDVQQVQLNGVACTTSTRCLAVGTQSASGNHMFAERWNGTSWTLQTTPTLSGQSDLRAISCASSSACMAVGARGGSTKHPLVERWNGTSWSKQSLPLTADGSVLNAVSCPTSAACTAVGTAGTQGRLVLHWDGASWKKQSTPAPTETGAKSATLRNVLCRTATKCMAVGDYSLYTGCCDHVGRTLVERWNGTTWAVQDSYHANNAALYDVACSASTACTAVGDLYSATEPRSYPVALRWNGSSWTPQNTGSWNGTAVFLGVSCPALHKCFAVGSDGDASGVSSSLVIARWNGTDWLRQR